MRDLKYIAAYSIPVVALFGIYFKGLLAYATPVYAFVFLPFLELLLPVDAYNLNDDEFTSLNRKKLFDWMLYLNLPMVYGILIFALFSISAFPLRPFEAVGVILSAGIVVGVNGINVGHELGHRQASKERFLGKALLLPALYMHFYIEHNFGHHLHAATPEDPATAKYNQTVYSFWISSTLRQYRSAWKIQKRLLSNYNLSTLSFRNDMLWYIIIQLNYLAGIYMFFGFDGLLAAIGIAITGFLLLETVNYIEHYGLLRLKTKSGRYERVQERHSWNSNHVIGRIVLYELTRHSDHHYKSSKKYQVLACHEDSPQMPFGYPTSMVLSLIPPLWFRVMNKRVPKEMILTPSVSNSQ
ncbi:MAG: alkane 1-monooxygenase [Bacteroidia bacterium]|nr:alkane 1-monooxygenase [Bacteroidia bacterium]MBT8286626.1 alkane 1-monooxygenase [Bacteroidia bacterium]